jgi:predicted ester cyclase
MKNHVIQCTIVAAGVLLFLTLTGCAHRAINGTDSTSENIALVKRFIDQVVNGGDINAVDKLWTQDMQWHSASMPDVKGRGAYKKMLEASVGGAFTDMHLEIMDVIAQSDKVVLYFTNSGTNTGDFMGHKATGKHAKWIGMGIYRIENGRIAEAWFSEDILGMFMQLGLIKM